jgi:heterotetrameric sarcosine oxidase gamma subunit
MPDSKAIEIDDILSLGGGRARAASRITQVFSRALIRLTSWAPSNTLPSLVSPEFEGEIRVLAVAPSEWWVVSDRIEARKLREQLERGAAGEGMVAVDLSCAVKALRIEGSGARDVLTRSCGLELDPSRFPTRRCTRTRLAQLTVLIDCIETSSCFDLYVSRSYVTYLHTWLTDAAIGLELADKGAVLGW